MLQNPLCPFFVLFCNVVATSDQRDFELIKKITDNLSQFAKANASIGKVYGLFSKFLELCAPLIKRKAGASIPENVASASSNTSRVDGDAPRPMKYLSADMFGQGPNALSGPVMRRETPSVPRSVEGLGWDDSLMWELFGNQPSLEWADSELWDTMTLLNSAS